MSKKSLVVALLQVFSSMPRPPQAVVDWLPVLSTLAKVIGGLGVVVGGMIRLIVWLIGKIDRKRRERVQATEEQHRAEWVRETMELTRRGLRRRVPERRQGWARWGAEQGLLELSYSGSQMWARRRS